MATARTQPPVAQPKKKRTERKRFFIIDEDESQDGHRDVPVFTLETAAGSVPALDPPRDDEEIEAIAKEEKVAATMREMRRG